jgi:hypothetical protein
MGINHGCLNCPHENTATSRFGLWSATNLNGNEILLLLPVLFVGNFGQEPWPIGFRVPKAADYGSYHTKSIVFVAFIPPETNYDVTARFLKEAGNPQKVPCTPQYPRPVLWQPARRANARLCLLFRTGLKSHNEKVTPWS